MKASSNGFRSVLALASVLLAYSALQARELPVASANDNTVPAGTRTAGTVTVHLEVREARWYPDKDGGDSIDVQAFGEAGALPRIPGPLLRVTEGTTLDVTIDNRLPKPVRIYGLHTRPGDPRASAAIAAGATERVRFLAGAPGTYYYWATTTDKPLDERDPEETQLSGAFIVDPAGETARERVFVITIWYKCTANQADCFEVQAINGKSWPFTERFTFAVGETVRWRWVNTSFSDHAMHLHGFFFTVDGVGDGERDVLPEGSRARPEVTRHLEIGGTFRMRWTPETPGNWLIHCHMTAHMERHPPVNADPRTAYDHHIDGFDGDAGMGGLILGVTVQQPPESGERHAAAHVAILPARRLKMFVRPRPATEDGFAGYSYVLADDRQRSGTELPAIGKPLVLTRGEPVEIEIVNMLPEPTSVHWHGIELESYYDGVAGWTGSGTQITPPIAPGASFVAHLTPPRAGTFIYHTHWHDIDQLTGGLTGALIVIDPGEKYDPDRDRAFVFTRRGHKEAAAASFLLNGSAQPSLQRLVVGRTYRFRLVNITTNNSGLRAMLLDQGTPVRWRLVAKDGAALSAGEMTEQPANQLITVGETYDFEFTPDHPGFLLLQGVLPGDGLVATQMLRVVPR